MNRPTTTTATEASSRSNGVTTPHIIEGGTGRCRRLPSRCRCCPPLPPSRLLIVTLVYCLLLLLPPQADTAAQHPDSRRPFNDDDDDRVNEMLAAPRFLQSPLVCLVGWMMSNESISDWVGWSSS